MVSNRNLEYSQVVELKLFRESTMYLQKLKTLNINFIKL